MSKPTESLWRILSKITTVLLLTAFLLLFLVGISLPIIKPVHLVAFRSTSNDPVSVGTVTRIRFGVWGACAYSDFEVGASQIDGIGYCVGPLFRYSLSSEVKARLGIPDRVVDAIEVAIRTVLILHPIAALLILTAVIFFYLPFLRHDLSLTLCETIFAGLLTTVIFGIELTLPILGRRKIAKLQDFDFSVEVGNDVCMVLVAAICLWITVILVALLKRAHVNKEGNFEGIPQSAP